MFFDDMAEEFKRYLSNIPFGFDLYVTTDTEEKRRNIGEVFAAWQRGKVEVRVSPNRGRDIAPKLVACRDVYDSHEYVLHLHTKSSPHARNLAGWRRYLLETLIGSPAIVASVFAAFQKSPALGMLAPQHFEGIRPGIGWGRNFPYARSLARRLGLDIDIGRMIDFPSGSMFWARSAALAPILNMGLSLDDFPIEEGQQDGTLAHVIERLYFHVCEAAGYDWIKIARPELLRHSRRRVVGAQTPEALSEFIATHRVRLLDDGADVRLPGAKRQRNSGGDFHLSFREAELFALAYDNSIYRVLDFQDFVAAVVRLAAGQDSIIDFDERFYLASYPDVAEAVGNGGFPCGYIHYCVAGKNEGRFWRNHENPRRVEPSPVATTVNAEPD
jgi:hypothetical protein